LKIGLVWNPTPAQPIPKSTSPGLSAGLECRASFYCNRECKYEKHPESTFQHWMDLSNAAQTVDYANGKLVADLDELSLNHIIGKFFKV
jgi:hypothetical protein